MLTTIYQLGWPVQGIWATGMDGSDINAVSRSHSGHLLVTSDDFGKIHLFRYPVLKNDAGCLTYSGHSSHVMNVRWSAADEYLLSCGGNDKTVMYWRHTMLDVSGMHSNALDKSIGGEHSSFDITKDSADEDHDVSHLDSDDKDDFDEPTGGDEAGAVKPWKGAIRAPKNPPPISVLPPNSQLELEWVHGYTSSSTGKYKISHNLFYNSIGTIIYPAASLGVMLYKDGNNNNNSSSSSSNGNNNGKNTIKIMGKSSGSIINSKATLRQSYLRGHDGDILCLTISPNRLYIATGQIASVALKGKGSIIIWDALQGRLLSRMDGCHQRAVTSLAFSPDSNQLISVGQDDNNTHTLWTDLGGGWSRVQQVATSSGDKSPILFSHWVHHEHLMVKNNEYHFVSGGLKGVNFWKVEGSAISKKPGRFSKRYKEAPLLCAANIHGKDKWRLVIGTGTGDLYIYDEREISDAVEGAHKGGILCIAEGSSDCQFIISGGRDHLIKTWNNALQPISSFDISSYSCMGKKEGKLVVIILLYS